LQKLFYFEASLLTDQFATAKTNLMETLTDKTFTCPACKIADSGNLCSNCGEVLQPQRITFGKLLKDIPDIFDLEYGLLYTIRTFFTRPGHEIREYFAGDRQKHYKPIKFILFIGGLVTFLMVGSDIRGVGGNSANDLNAQWESAIMIFQFPIIALCTWLIFKKRKYNFGEHLVANAFLIGEVIVYKIILFPLYLVLNGTAGVDTLTGFYLLWILCYYTYAYYDWFYHRSTAPGFFKALGVTCFIFVVVAISTIPIEFLISKLA
jgi:hypothetical protein